jgi:hypothetical protein
MMSFSMTLIFTVTLTLSKKKEGDERGVMTRARERITRKKIERDGGWEGG